MTFAKKALILGAASAVTAGLAVPVIAQSSSISGAGATFPAPAYQRWAVEFAKETKKQVNYQSVGSGAGVRQFHAGSVDFGATDEELQEKKGEFTAGAAGKRGALQIPMMGGTVTPAYNNPGCKNLKLTQAQVADIFLGKIKTWDQLKCGKGPITVAHRSDGSGTTYVFTNSLSCFSPEWKSKVGTGKAVKWPVGVGGKGNEGVAGLIQNTPGSIGYLNQAFVKGKITPAAVQNKAGKFVLANDVTGAAALNSVKLDARLGGEDCNPAGANSFPIASFTWVLAYKTGNGAKTDTIKQFFLWGLSPKGQAIAKQLDYVPLTGAVLARARAEVAKIGK
ncbi:phosphate ABC transporter substrate-binding protein PstS [Cyanobium sp. N5-Cardenillas]|uniref:phosphate ABC transporter substrate-binding protein PstS n=1 Tax=Cyanobium sp. N5-Cardenillas TaxID=2823720 RepID=UPI0020CEF3F3|nr:phosphate ABC transporter substrate-binding protein PstS [Cyanobium sp. N5-Cardenillas]MCP9786741.1 phosphate ABC transporter substrate-binding protein PstS [Cyanobium sp. N5-Cardenillas]